MAPRESGLRAEAGAGTLHRMQRRALLATALPFAAAAQADWPAQPVRFVVPVAAGGPTDVPARIVAEAMSGFLRNRIVVENRTGSGIVVGTDMVARAPRDGLTLLYGTIAHAFARAVFTRLPFDPVADFAPVALIGQIPMVMLVNNDLPVRSLAELIALLRANPGRYDYASAGNGSSVHLATELFLRSAGGLQMNHVPFRGTAAAVPDLLAGRVHLVVEVGTAALPLAQRGALRPLAISLAQRSAVMPEVPSFAEAGLPGYEVSTWHMVMAPTGTPAPVIEAINAAVNRAIATPAIAARLTELAMDVAQASTPASAAAFLAAEIAKWEPIIRAAGIRAD